MTKESESKTAREADSIVCARAVFEAGPRCIEGGISFIVRRDYKASHINNEIQLKKNVTRAK